MQVDEKSAINKLPEIQESMKDIKDNTERIHKMLTVLQSRLAYICSSEVPRSDKSEANKPIRNALVAELHEIVEIQQECIENLNDIDSRLQI